MTSVRLPAGPIYSFDTSGLIDGIERFYPPRNFPGLWQRVDGLIAEGRLVVSEEAWAEAIGVDAPVKEWCLEHGAGRERCVYPTDAAVATVVGGIVADYPSWVTQGRKNGADPFVIAVAEITSARVISGELGGGPAKPKIPYVCQQRAVACGRFVDVIREEGWVIG